LGITGVLKLCHKKGVDLVSHRPDSDYDYLHMACMGDKWGHGESVRYLLELGADVNIRSTKDKHSCMERYARFDHVQDVLKEYGAIHDEIPWEDL
jgi:ankyrin repeat protein